MAETAGVVISPATDHRADADRRMATRAMRIGLWAWPSFFALDAYMCLVAYPGAPLLLFAGYRAVMELAFYAVYRASRRPASDVRQVFWGLNLCYGGAAVAIALMAVHLGGIRSPYMHGISIVALVRAAVVPGPWRRAWPTYVRVGLAFPLVMGLGIALSPLLRAEWLSADALIVFASNYVFVVSSSFLGLVSGHMVWRTQEQLFRARRVGRYRLQAPIGRGGMGEVWLAWDLSLRRNVALKLLRMGPDATMAAVRRFEREARAASQLRGPHIVRIFDFGASDDGLYYIAMEYLTGLDLGTMVERFGPLPPARATHFMMQACRALDEAHEAGIIHRDLKPHNLFVTRVGDDPEFVKLLDFGVVRLRVPDPGAEPLTSTGLLVGTPAYVAPELWGGAPADERSDVYALGVTLHFLLTGTTPFEGWLPVPIVAHGGTAPPVASLHRAEAVSTALAAIVRRCIVPRPEERLASVRDLYRALEATSAPGAWTRGDADRFWRDADRARFG
jgi:serine/threonine-protein kinase